MEMPMELVADTSALLAVLLHEPERPALIAATQGATLAAPASVRWEVGNGLVAGLRRRRLTGRQVQAAWESFEQVPLRLMDVAIPAALRLAEDLGLCAYDAYVLTVAQQRRAPLVTLDRRLTEAAAALGLDVVEVAR
jgi:predicted nucleic acid-binding protein